MLPNARPAIVTVFMLSLVWNWNDSFTQTFLSMSRNTVAVYLTQIRGMLGTMTAEYEDPTYLYILIQAGARCASFRCCCCSCSDSVSSPRASNAPVLSVNPGFRVLLNMEIGR